MKAAPQQLPWRALIYNRASADKTGQRVSVESQDTENHAWCEREGWQVAETITDNDRSATRYATRDRDGYRRMREGLASGAWGRIDVLVMWESSRGERSLDGHVEMRALCAQFGVRLAYKGRVLDMREGDDRFTAGLDALLDEREAERARERILRSHRDSVARGLPRSAAPFGYRRTYDPATRRMTGQVPDPHTAPTVAQIVADLLAGSTLYAVAQRLNRDGVRTPKQRHDDLRGVSVARGGWTSSMIRNLLAKPSLMGMRTHRGVIVGEGRWEPIMSPADWRAVQTLLKDPGRARHHGGLDAKWLLSGIAACGVCGGWLRPMSNRGRMTYVCAGLTPTSPKGHVHRGQAPLDAWVTVRVTRRLARPEFRAAFQRPAQPAQQTDDARRELDDARAQLAEYEASAGTPGGVSAAAFARIEARLAGRIGELEQLLSPPRRMSPLVASVAGPNAVAVWDRLTVEERRQVLREVCTRIVVLPAVRRGVRGFDPDLVVLEFADG